MKQHAVYLAWLVALVGFCLSIFYGEILRNPPCPLCWYQRIALFPLVLLLGMAAYRGDFSIIPYAVPIAALGGVIALFHVLYPYLPFLQKVHVCTLGVSCSHVGFAWGDLSLFALLSATGFSLIAILLLFASKGKS